MYMFCLLCMQAMSRHFLRAGARAFNCVMVPRAHLLRPAYASRSFAKVRVHRQLRALKVLLCVRRRAEPVSFRDTGEQRLPLRLCPSLEGGGI